MTGWSTCVFQQLPLQTSEWYLRSLFCLYYLEKKMAFPIPEILVVEDTIRNDVFRTPYTENPSYKGDGNLYPTTLLRMRELLIKGNKRP